jgi:hypothetical protein
MNMPLALLNRRRRIGGFSPNALFALAEPGVWFDPSDVANLTWRRNLLVATDAPVALTGVSVTTNAATAPDGTNNAARVTKTDSTTPRYTTQSWASQTALPNRAYTVSRFVKYDGFDTTVSLEYNQAGNFDLAWVAPFSVTASGVTANTPTLCTSSVQDVGNGWYRIIVNLTSGAAPTTSVVNVLSRVTGASGVSVLMYGAQLELGSVATDYQRITDVNTEVIERFPTATLYQDTAGTTPVTTTGQSVGLMLDKSKGLVLGSELVTNGTFDSGTTGWTLSGGTATVSSGQVTISGAATRYFSQSFTTVVGQGYRVRGTIVTSGATFNAIRKADNATASTNAVTFISAAGTTEGVFIATATTTHIVLQVNDAGTATFDNISVKELPGNHAVQATTANRPTYGVHPFGGRRNLLTWTTFGGAVAGTPGTAPTDWPFNSSGGSITSISNEVIAFSATAARQIVGRVINVAANQTQIWGVTVVSNPNSLVFNQLFTLINPTGLTSFLYYANGALVDATSYVPLANDRLTVVLVNGGSASTPTFRIGVGASGVATGSASFTQSQAELGSTATAYQRVTDQYNVTEAGVSSVSYLFFDGVNDSLATSTITPGTDKAQVFAGVRKLSDAATGIFAELSANSFGTTNQGAFYLTVPHGTSASERYGFFGKGAVAAASGQVSTTSNGPAPDTAVITGLGDISGDLNTLRRNGVAGTNATADQGTGNFLAYPLYIGARAGTSLFFSGHLYGLIARFGPNLATGQISSTETWVAGKTGITI